MCVCEGGLHSSGGALASHCSGFSCCREKALEHAGFSGCGTWPLENKLSSCGAWA